MKVGVVTFTNTLDNYGQVVQALATLEYLQSRGHDASIVQPVDCRCVLKPSLGEKIRRVADRIKGAIYRRTIGLWFPEGMKSAEAGLWQRRREKFAQFLETTIRKEAANPRRFDEFRYRHFGLVSGRCEEVLAFGYDAFCVGSDQLWGCAHSSHFLLDWVPVGIKRFSIATSTGGTMPLKREIPAIRRALRMFEFITVRENCGIEYCCKCGRRDAIRILDPVFLVDAARYMDIAICPNRGKRHVFIYMLGSDIEIPVHEISNFFRTKGIEVRYVESQGRDEPEEENRVDATIEEWLGLLANAAYVITNSFHGMAMSIIFHKPFLVFELVGLMAYMNGRIRDLATQMCLESRIYKGDLQAMFNPVDWKRADECIATNRKKVDRLIKGIET